MARLSIGIPVYNGGQFFRPTLDSLLAQTYTDFELLISDNASTDNTEEIAREYVARDARVRYFRNETNIGLGPNHNHVFAQARGEYFKFAPADDLYHPTYLERCIEILDRDPAVVIAYPKTRFIAQDGNALPIEDPGWHLMSDSAAERFRYVLRHGHWANVILGVVRREALAKTHVMPSYPGGDFRLIGELSLLGKFYEIPEYLFLRRLHGRSSSQHVKDLRWEAAYWAMDDQKLPWPFLELKRDHFLTLILSQLHFYQKVSLTASLLRGTIASRRTFVHELRSHVDFYSRRRPRKTASADCGEVD